MNLRTLFPNASKATVAVNPGLAVSGQRGKGQNDSTGRTPYSAKMLMNKTESEFAQRLEMMKHAGEILRYEYEGITLRWADMRYTPDFIVFGNSVVTHDPEENVEIKRFRIKLIEVKGPHIHYRQQAVARFKGARAWWPQFEFECWQKKKTGWTRIY